MKKVAALMLLCASILATPLSAAGCPYECKNYSNGDKFCWEFLSGNKGYLYTCEVNTWCYPYVDGTWYCEVRCDGQQCYIA